MDNVFEAMKESNEMGFIWLGSFLHRIQTCGGESLFEDFRSPLIRRGWSGIDLFLGIFSEDDSDLASGINVEIRPQDGPIAHFPYKEVRDNFPIELGDASVKDGNVIFRVGSLKLDDFPALHGGRGFYTYFWEVLNICENIFKGNIGLDFKERKYYSPYVKHGSTFNFTHETKWEFFMPEFEAAISAYLDIEADVIRKMNFFEIYFFIAELFEFVGPKKFHSESGAVGSEFGVWDDEFSYNRLASWPDPRLGFTYQLKSN